MSDVLPMLPGGRADMDYVCAGQVPAKPGEQLVLREQGSEYVGRGRPGTE